MNCNLREPTMAIVHALVLFIAVSVAFNISGGHINPAVTFGALVGSRISIARTISTTGLLSSSSRLFF